MMHTPTPWAYDEQRWTNHTRHIIHAGDQLYPIADVAEYHSRPIKEARANASIIVRAVNSHDALVEALERLLRISKIDLEKKRPDVIHQAQEALTLAKKG